MTLLLITGVAILYSLLCLLVIGWCRSAGRADRESVFDFSFAAPDLAERPAPAATAPPLTAASARATASGPLRPA